MIEQELGCIRGQLELKYANPADSGYKYNGEKVLLTPPLSLATVMSGSPPRNTPTKLPCFLQYAEEKEGIQNATMFELSQSEKGFGPDDIMMDDIDKNDLIACGLNAGDALCLKCAACTWWTSPDAKHTHQTSPTPDHPTNIDNHACIWFEK